MITDGTDRLCVFFSPSFFFFLFYFCFSIIILFFKKEGGKRNLLLDSACTQACQKTFLWHWFVLLLCWCVSDAWPAVDREEEQCYVELLQELYLHFPYILAWFPSTGPLSSDWMVSDNIHSQVTPPCPLICLSHFESFQPEWYRLYIIVQINHSDQKPLIWTWRILLEPYTVLDGIWQLCYLLFVFVSTVFLSFHCLEAPLPIAWMLTTNS